MSNQHRDIDHAHEIVADLGGYPQLAKACGVPYRRGYGWVEQNSIPAKYDLRLVAALKAAGSNIDLLTLARWRARLADKDTIPCDGKPHTSGCARRGAS